MSVSRAFHGVIPAMAIPFTMRGLFRSALMRPPVLPPSAVELV